MKLGEKLRQARQEAGLSQRQLCAGIVTRNMLSLIENGTANPSMDTLKQLCARLGKPVSFFLEEEAVLSPNGQIMASARQHFDRGRFDAVLEQLSGFQSPDPVHDRERQLLMTLSLLGLAEQALMEHRLPYAQKLLDQAAPSAPYCAEDLERRRLLLLARTAGEAVSHRLPSLDPELLVRAGEALRSGDPVRAGQLLDAAQDHAAPEWNLLRGKIFMELHQFHPAAACLHQAEAAFPLEAAPLLETCYRELEDYKRAYEYACKRR